SVAADSRIDWSWSGVTVSGAVLESLQAASVNAPNASTPARARTWRERVMVVGRGVGGSYDETKGLPTKRSKAAQGYEMHDEICRRRLAGQFLTTAGPETGADVVRALGAVQAQDYASAKWAVAQRTTGRSDAEIERELETGQILRTHVLRPTWHF